MQSYNGFTPAQRMRALNWAKKGYADGSRKRPTVCDACGQTKGALERHSEDYSEPFGDHIGAYGLCFSCHMFLHCRFRSPERWTEYRDFIRKGAVFAPNYHRNFPVFRRTFLEAATLPAPAYWREPPTRWVLDEIEDAHRAQ